MLHAKKTLASGLRKLRPASGQKLYEMTVYDHMISRGASHEQAAAAALRPETADTKAVADGVLSFQLLVSPVVPAASSIGGAAPSVASRFAFSHESVRAGAGAGANPQQAPEETGGRLFVPLDIAQQASAASRVPHGSPSQQKKKQQQQGAAVFGAAQPSTSEGRRPKVAGKPMHKGDPRASARSGGGLSALAPPRDEEAVDVEGTLYWKSLTFSGARRAEVNRFCAAPQTSGCFIVTGANALMASGRPPEQHQTAAVKLYMLYSHLIMIRDVKGESEYMTVFFCSKQTKHVPSIIANIFTSSRCHQVQTAAKRAQQLFEEIWVFFQVLQNFGRGFQKQVSINVFRIHFKQGSLHALLHYRSHALGRVHVR